jgi:hypothetical protein
VKILSVVSLKNPLVRKNGFSISASCFVFLKDQALEERVFTLGDIQSSEVKNSLDKSLDCWIHWNYLYHIQAIFQIDTTIPIFLQRIFQNFLRIKQGTYFYLITRQLIRVSPKNNLEERCLKKVQLCCIFSEYKFLIWTIIISSIRRKKNNNNKPRRKYFCSLKVIKLHNFCLLNSYFFEVEG